VATSPYALSSLETLGSSNVVRSISMPIFDSA
jgi:hypothetical protein